MMSDYYLVKMVQGKNIHTFTLAADDIDQAANLAMDLGFEDYLVAPDEWDKIEVKYIGDKNEH